MSNTPRNNFALLQYYARENLWCHCQTVANDLALALSDTTFLLWRAYASDRIGLAAEALRDYKNCEGRKAVNAGALHGLRQIYKRNRDRDGFDRTEAKLQVEEKSQNYSALLQAALILWYSGETQRARDIANYVANQEEDFRDEYTSVQLVRGWLELSVGKMTSAWDKCLASFDRVLTAEAVDGLLDVDALMGKVNTLERKVDYFRAQDLLNKCIVTHPNFSPAFLVKAKQLMRVEDFEQARETVQRVLQRDPQNVEALILLAIMSVVREYKVQEAAATLTELSRALKAREPRNWTLMLSCAQAFSRLSCGDSQLLALTMQFVEGAKQIAPQNSEVTTEIGYHHLLRGDARAAKAEFQKAASSNDGNITPLLGLIRCAVTLGAYDDASRQVDYVNEHHPQMQKHVELLVLGAMVRWRKFRDQAGSLERLDAAVEQHRIEVQAMPIGVSMFIKLNATGMLDMAREYVQHCRTEPVAGSNPDPVVEKTRRLLDLLLRNFPGCAEGQLFNARMCFVNGEVDKAQRVIAQCLKLDPNNAEVFLLQARIAIYTGNLQPAGAALEQALALDFEMQDMPQFALLRGIILNAKGSYGEAQRVLEGGLKVMKAITAAQTTTTTSAAAAAAAGGGGGQQQQQQNVKTAASSSSSSAATAAAAGGGGGTGTAAATAAATQLKYAGKNAMISVQDHASIYLQLAQAQVRQKSQAQARETIGEAARVFRDTLQAGRVTIAQAMLVGRTDVEQALGILKSIPASSPHYIAAKKQQAMLHLNVRGNRREYAKCFEELVEHQQTFESFVALGDAYTAISEPDKAITAFDKARAKDPNNALLAVKIGRTLVTTHDYQRALKYYRDAVAAERGNVGLRTDLASLFWRLGDFERAIQTLRDAPVLKQQQQQQQQPQQKGPLVGGGGGGDDIGSEKERVTLFSVEAKIWRSAGNAKACCEALLSATYHQNLVVQKLRNDPEAQFAQKQIASNICTELGEWYLKSRTPGRAQPMFEDALRHDEGNERAMLNLAKIHEASNELDACEAQCNDILRVSPTCEDATVMLANVTFRRSRFEDAAYHYNQLLDRAPENYSALCQFLNLLRKAGRLRDAAAQAALSKAERALKPGTPTPQGLQYANAFHLRHTGRAREALAFFNQARVPKDTEWGQRSVQAMVEIYLMPDGENLWEDVGGGAVSSESSENHQASLVLADNIHAAEGLVGEIVDPDRRGVLQAYILIATKQQENLEKAVEILNEVQKNSEARRAGASSASAATTATATAAAASGSGSGGGGDLEGSVVAAAGEEGDASASGSGSGGAIVAGGHVPSLVALAIAYQCLRNPPKVRNNLKKAEREVYAAEDEDDGERGMVLAASTYVETGKMDMASNLLKKVIHANKSSARAWEMLGLINEKEQCYQDAADCYANAWKITNEADPHLGYKLSFNFLKAKRYVQAIDIAKKVLGMYPSYPRIAQDVLEKGRSLLKL